MSALKSETLLLPEEYYDSSKPNPAQMDETVVIERLLLLAFLVVATATVAWHLTTGLHWMWSNCAAHLHFAIVEDATRPL
jgi:Flp pilus assembly pilin Flp